MNYFKRHFVVIFTVLCSIVASVVINFISEVTLAENMIITLLVLLITSFIFDITLNMDKVEKTVDEYGRHIYPSTVLDFDAVDKCAIEVTKLIRSGKHRVDFVSLDEKIRTSAPQKTRPMFRLLDKLVSSENIKLRYITTIKAENYQTILNFIIKSRSSQKESFYAFCVNTVPFASFYLIDKKYLVIRTPYNSTVEKHYCIIEDKTICALFISWFEMLWQSSHVINKDSDIDEIFEKCKEGFTSADLIEIQELTDKAKKYF